MSNQATGVVKIEAKPWWPNKQQVWLKLKENYNAEISNWSG